ncbi:MAG: bifunctional riboflavin kinase/FAD synthetase [Pelagibacterales bacterium]|nr:bifunctional riboflavin kinase/FAD synthetase [Pelagibacterales bacterium]
MVKRLKFYNKFNVSEIHKRSILLIGNFDGFHLGHKKLFRLANKYKKKLKLKIGVITFEPMPKMYFDRSLKNFRISNLNQKIKNLRKFGVDFVVIKKFDKKFSKITSHNFIKDILYKNLKAKYIFVSNNFRFGNKREGTVKQLTKNQKVFKFKIIKPKPLILRNKVISSTLIRKLLFEGKLEYVNKLLARNWSIDSRVQKGRKMGKRIGFPTCNMDIKDYVIPKLGVYAVKIHQKNNSKILKGIANIGYRPTFKQKKLLLEVYIFNFSDNLYNKYLTIEFINFIRKEKKFKNINQLKKQINSDLKLVKKKLN